jgi:hypothetical protein
VRRAYASVLVVTSTRKVDKKFPEYFEINELLAVHTQVVLRSLTARWAADMYSVGKMRLGVDETPRTVRPNRCYQCNGRFGLIRHKSALKQFCSKACLAEYRASSEREVSRLKAWTTFLTRK